MRNFDSRLSFKRRDLFPLLYRVFKQISLQKLSTCFQWDYYNFKDKSFKENIDSLETVESESFTKAFQKTKNPSRLTYRYLVATKSEKPIASQTKWHRDCDLDEEEIDWNKTFQLTRACTKSTKLIIFQFKFLHRRLQIPFCIRLHLKIMIFVPFARKKRTLCSTFSGKRNHLVMTTALGLKSDSSNTKLLINFSCLMSRYFIWTCELRDEIHNLPQSLRLLKKTYEISFS